MIGNGSGAAVRVPVNYVTASLSHFSESESQQDSLHLAKVDDGKLPHRVLVSDSDFDLLQADQDRGINRSRAGLLKAQHQYFL